MKIATKPWFVPDTTTLQDQLNAFLRRKAHFAIVVDEYGEVEGLVTLEDIIEEIVGEIADEHDIDVQGVKQEADGSVVVDGTVPIRDLNRALDWQLPDDEATTIAGLVIHETQSIPEERQAFTFHGKRFVVMKRDKNRITRIRIRPVAEMSGLLRCFRAVLADRRGWRYRDGDLRFEVRFKAKALELFRQVETTGVPLSSPIGRANLKSSLRRTRRNRTQARPFGALRGSCCATTIPLSQLPLSRLGRVEVKVPGTTGSPHHRVFSPGAAGSIASACRPAFSSSASSCVDGAVALDAAHAGKGRRHDADAEMRLALAVELGVMAAIRHGDGRHADGFR